MIRRPSHNAFLSPVNSQRNILAPFVTPAQPAEEYSNLQFNPQNIPPAFDQVGLQQQGFAQQNVYLQQQGLHQHDQMHAQMNNNVQGNQPQELDPYATGQPFLDPSVPSDAIRSNFSILNIVLSRTVYVGNIKPELTQAQMMQIIESLTDLKIETYVVSNKVVSNMKSQSAKNCAFVKMYTRAHAEKLRDLLPLFPFEDGSQFKVLFIQTKV